jgi:hypothetical protein
VVIDPNSADTIVLNGVPLTQDQNITTNGSNVGSFVLRYQAANTIEIIANGFAAVP